MIGKDLDMILLFYVFSALFSVDVSIAQLYLFSDDIISSDIKTRMQGNVHSEILESITDISHQSTANLSFVTKCSLQQTG